MIGLIEYNGTLIALHGDTNLLILVIDSPFMSRCVPAVRLLLRVRVSVQDVKLKMHGVKCYTLTFTLPSASTVAAAGANV